MIEKIYKFWGIKDDYIFGDEFTGYEDLYPEFDKLTKEEYEKDPENTMDRCFNLYRNRGIVPIIYFTEKGIKNSVHWFYFENINYRVITPIAFCNVY